MLQQERCASRPFCEANPTGQKSFIAYEAEAIFRISQLR